MANDTWNSQAYESILRTLVQEKGPKLQETVMVSYGFDNDEYKYVNQVGSADFNTITERLGKTNWEEIDRYRRRISKQRFEKAFLFDSFEELDQNVDPTSKTTFQLMMGYGRKVDSVVIAAANATASAGKAGGTSTTLASYASGTHVVSPATGMTVDVMRGVKKRFGIANVDGEYDPIYWVVSPYQTDDMLGITEIKSSDYNVTKVLVNGKINSFMGFIFKESNQLTDDGSTTTTLVYAKTGIELCISKGFTLTADRLPDYRNAVGFQAQCAMGGVRLEEAKVQSVALTYS